MVAGSETLKPGTAPDREPSLLAACAHDWARRKGLLFVCDEGPCREQRRTGSPRRTRIRHECHEGCKAEEARAGEEASGGSKKKENLVDDQRFCHEYRACCPNEYFLNREWPGYWSCWGNCQ